VAERNALLSVEDLRVEFSTRRGTVYAVNGISFDIARGETLGIVGESGCGKSVTSLAVLGLLARNGRVRSGRTSFEGRDLLQMNDRALRQIRGREIAMIFQDPMTSLNPVLTIGKQIREALKTHFGMDRKQAEATAVEALARALSVDPRHSVREAAAEALGKIGTPATMDVLVGALGDAHSTVRESAAAALGETGRPDALGALTQTARTDADPWVRQNAAGAVAKLTRDEAGRKHHRRRHHTTADER